MSLADGKEQFSIAVRVDGKMIKEQAIHDPFIFNRTVVCISRWDLFKGLFQKKQFTVKVEVNVRGSLGVERAIMMLDPGEIEKETETILADRKASRDKYSTDPQMTNEARVSGTATNRSTGESAKKAKK